MSCVFNASMATGSRRYRFFPQPVQQYGRSVKRGVWPTNFPIAGWFWYKVPAMKSRFYKVGVATALLFLVGDAILGTRGGNR